MQNHCHQLNTESILAHRGGSGLGHPVVGVGGDSRLCTEHSGVLGGRELYHYICFLFLRFHLFCFLERGREGEREGEKHQCVAASPQGPGLQCRHVP